MSEHFLHELILIAGVGLGFYILFKDQIKLSRSNILAFAAVLVVLFSEVGLNVHLLLHGQSGQLADGYHSCCLPITVDAVSVAEFIPQVFFKEPEDIFLAKIVISPKTYLFQNKSPPVFG